MAASEFNMEGRRRRSRSTRIRYKLRVYTPVLLLIGALVVSSGIVSLVER